MTRTFTETLQTPVAGSCDVFVLGGGIAGISAALAAARMGKKVLLCEKSFILGGLATSGLVAIYLPLCDGMGRQVSFGIAEELLRLSVSEWTDGKRGVENWLRGNDPARRTEKNHRFDVEFNPQLLALQTEQLLLDNGVEVLYGTSAAACVREGNRITAVITENKTGRRAYTANTFVDASGDCDLAFFSGTPTVEFRQGNILAAWYYFLQDGASRLKILGCSDIPDEDKTNGKTGPEKLVARRFLGLDGKELSEMTVLSHQSMHRDVQSRMRTDPAAIPVTMATIPQVRMTRRIAGAVTMDTKDAHVPCEHSVGMVSDWKKRGPVYEVPFEALYCPDTVNLICAGRCVSNTDAMWDIMRVIPCCAVTGEAAGTGAAMADDFTRLSVPELQSVLRKNGVVIHESEL